MKKFFLNQRVILLVIFYSLLPRSIFYFPKIPAIVFFMIFLSMLIFYIVLRYRIIAEKVSNKSFIILDTLLTLAGVVLACVFNSSEVAAMLCIITAIPMFINNYKVVKNWDNTCENT